MVHRNPKRRLEYQREWRARNPDYMRKYMAKWKADNPDYFPNHQKQRRLKAKAWLDDYKLSRGCQQCGYAEHPAALEFHHRNPEHKVLVIGQAKTRKFELIKEEVAKCDVLCANCHRVVEANKREEKERCPLAR